MSARRRDSGRERVVGPSQRQLRVGEELRHALVQILRDNHARDPDLRDANVTVTEVQRDLTGDAEATDPEAPDSEASEPN